MDILGSADRLRRLAGTWLDAAGLGPIETPARRVHAGPAFDLLGYARPRQTGPVVLLLPAPVKRAYIWDLHPRASVVRRCLERGLRVYLLRWTEPAAAQAHLGLEDYAHRFIADAVSAIEAETGEGAPVLAGHSLGGTFAALFAAARPERVGRLVLLEAPLCFAPAGAGVFEPLAATGPSIRSVARALPTVPGMLLDLASVTVAPDVFLWERWIDLVLSAGDAGRLQLHGRVERWLLDELPWPGRLLEDVVDVLYREDRFMRGTLALGERAARPGQVVAPILAVVDRLSRVVPAVSVLPFLEAAGSRDATVLEYRGDRGVALQHVGVLIGAGAHRHLWPRILDWIVGQR